MGEPKTIEQRYEVSTPCLRTISAKKERIGDGLQIVHSVLSYRPEMLVVGTHL